MKKSSKLNKIIVSISAIIVVVCLIITACFIGNYYNGKKSNQSVEWFLSIINDYYYQDVSTEDFDNYTFKSFVEEYLDSYSAYYTAEEYEALVASNSGSKSGFGITYSYVQQKGVLVSSVIYNSPAYISGLRSGDYIVSAEKDGKTTEFSAQSDFTSFVSALTDGEEVTFNTSDGAGYAMAKSEYTASYVACATNENSWAFISDGSDISLTQTDTDIIEDLPDGAGYICLTQFYGDAANEFAQAVEVLNSESCTSIIIDLRNNGGGYVSTMQQISACFVDAGEEAMIARYKDGSEEIDLVEDKYITSDGCRVKEDTKVYVLANGSTASASEALIGVLLSYGVIDYQDIYLSEYSEEYISLTGGTAESLKSCRTYGKGIMQSTYVNKSTGEALKLTTAQIYWPDEDRTSIHGVGITTADGANAVAAPRPLSGKGEELSNAIAMIYG